jgi:hypothetical protein
VAQVRVVVVLTLESVEHDALRVHIATDIYLLVLTDNRQDSSIVPKHDIHFDEELSSLLDVRLYHRLFVDSIVFIVDVTLNLDTRPAIRPLSNLTAILTGKSADRV